MSVRVIAVRAQPCLNVMLLITLAVMLSAAFAQSSRAAGITAPSDGQMPNGVTVNVSGGEPGEAVLLYDLNNNMVGSCDASGDGGCGTTLFPGVWDYGTHAVSFTIVAWWFNHQENRGETSAPITLTLQPPAWAVSLTMPSTVTEPDSIPATIDVSPAIAGGHSVDLYDADSGSYADFSCATDRGECTGNVPTGWLGPNPVTRHYVAEMRDGNTVVATSGIKAVTIKQPDWNVSLAMPDQVTMPDSFPVSIQVDPKTWSPNNVNVVDADNNDQWTGFSCATADGDCQDTFNSWWNPTAVTKTYRAQLKDGNTMLAADQKNVTFYPPDFGVTLDVPGMVLPGHSYTLKVTNSFNRYSPWVIVVRDGSGNMVGFCHTDDATCEFTMTAGAEGTSQSYTADISSGSTIINQASQITVQATDPLTAGAGGGAGGAGPGGFGGTGINLDDLAAEFGSAEAVCTALVNFPGTHFANSSESDQLLACEAVAESGGTSAVAIRAALAAMVGVASIAGGSQSLLDWLQNYVWVNYGDSGPPSNPTAPPVNPPADPPTSTPAPVETEANSLADALKARSATLTNEDADELARRCIYLVGAASLAGRDLCNRLPIFSPGSNHNEATQHRIDALKPGTGWPGWVMLHYRAGSRNSWYLSQPTCQVTGVGQACDEFPENKTYEGGSYGVAAGHTPSLRNIDANDNSGLGGRYGNFIQSCGMTDGEAFLMLPTPVALGKPTMWVC